MLTLTLICRIVFPHSYCTRTLSALMDQLIGKKAQSKSAPAMTTKCPMTLASLVHLFPHLPILRRAEQAWGLQREGREVMPRFVVCCFCLPQQLLPEPHLLPILTRNPQKTHLVSFDSPCSCFSTHTTFLQPSRLPCGDSVLALLCLVHLSCYTPKGGFSF